MTMGDEKFYWAVMSSNHQSGGMECVTVCEEAALTEVREQAHIHYVRVQVLPATFHESVILVTPEMLDTAVRMRDWLWGANGEGPGKVVGKQQMLRDAVLELLRLMTGGDDAA